MGAHPQLRVVAAVRDVAALERALTHGFGITRIMRHHDEKIDATLFGFSNGDMLVVSPHRADDDFDWLPAQSRAAFIALGVTSKTPAAEASREAGSPVGQRAPLSQLGLFRSEESGLMILLGSVPSFSAVDPGAPYMLDHIAAVVRNRVASAAELQPRLGAPRWIEGWEFPEFGTTNACLRFDEAYLELNEPRGAQGIFGATLAESGPGFLFVCLRATNPIVSLDQLRERGYSAQDSRAVHACAPGSRRPVEIGRVHSFSRRQTSGLRLTLFDTWWPWQLADERRERNVAHQLSREQN